MSEPWTSGPWHVEDDSGAALGGWWVAGPSWVFDGNNNVSIENEADARIIAVAPKMAELLEELIAKPAELVQEHHFACHWCEGEGGTMWGGDREKELAHTPDCPVVRCRALLARARGERP